MTAKQTASSEVVVERIFDAPPELVWQAITDPDMMRQWYFDLAEFRAEAGFQFEFTAGATEGTQYRHICEVTEVVPGRKLTYSWCYDRYGGLSHVTFALTPDNGGTRLKLSHTGLDTLAAEHPDFAADNFRIGWNQIINVSLHDLLAQKAGRAQ